MYDAEDVEFKFSRLRRHLNLFGMGFFEPSVIGGGGGGDEGQHHNFVVVAPMIMKSGTGVKLDVFYTMVTKKEVASKFLWPMEPPV